LTLDDARLVETIAADTDPAPRTGSPDLGQGSTIGRYIVLSKIGVGAMGIVYAAYDPELDRKVALKIVDARRTEDGSQGRGELLREAQAMARLSHPNVITVHDVGVVREHVFVAMELIDGVTLGRWLTAQPRRWREILGVFLPAGDGLVAAHDAGLVHRDFKPDNVLVGHDGRVHVTDFGIARVADDTDDGTSRRSGGPTTRRGADGEADDERATGLPRLFGTPAYMSPEQFVGADLDARCDQFGFCAALWEALYGQLPFSGRSVTQLALSVTRGELREPPANTGVPARLRRVLVRGLAADREARWPDMRTLLDELGRDPVRARRRMLGVGALLTIGGAAVWGLAQAQRPCTGADDKLQAVWDDARRAQVHEALRGSEVAYAEDTWHRVEDRLDAYAEAWVDMHVDACEATRVRGEQSAELLDLRVACLGGRLHELRALVDVLAQADAVVAERAVRSVGELPPIAACGDTEGLLLRRVTPPAADVAVEVEAIRAELTEAHTLQRAGRPQAARDRLQALVERARATEYGPIVADASFVFGLALEKVGTFDESEAALREAYFTAMRHRHDQVAAEAASTLVFVVGNRLARPDEGTEWAAHAEAAVGRWAPGGLEEARLRRTLGNVLHRQRKLDEARVQLERGVELSETTPGSSVAETEITRIGLAAVLLDAGELDAARDHYTRALDNLRAELGDDHPDVAIAHNGLGNAEYYAHRLDAADAHYREALRLWVSAYGEDYPGLCLLLSNLGNVADDRNEVDQARQYYQRAVDIGVRTVGPDHPDVAIAQQNLGMMLERTGDDAGALTAYQHSLRIREKTFGADHLAVARALGGLAWVHLRRGELDEARTYAERLVAIQQAAAAGKPSASVGTALTVLGRVQIAAGQSARARETLERSRELVEGQPISVARSQYALGLALERSDPARSRELIEQARATLAAQGPRTARDLAEVDAHLDAAP
jgi:tetratricopeptide (TPR) repeat protein